MSEQPSVFVMSDFMLDGSEIAIFAGVTGDREKAFAWALSSRRSDGYTNETEVSVDEYALDGTWLAGWRAEPNGMVDNNAGTAYAARDES